MSNIGELKSVLKETLKNRGVLGQMKARMRAEVFHALDDQLAPKPPLSNENMLINELIREYLEFNQYNYTLSVLMAESGQPRTPLDRTFLTSELKITEDPGAAQLPLLYGVLSHFLDGKGYGTSTRAHKPATHGRSDRVTHTYTRMEGQSTMMGSSAHVREPVIMSGLTRR